jgi:hypothetical protein
LEGLGLEAEEFSAVTTPKELLVEYVEWCWRRQGYHVLGSLVEL